MITLLRLQPDFLKDFAKHAERTVYVSDGNGRCCLSHEIYLNRLARASTDARVTGNFGSEVLRGVSTFKELPSRSAWANGELKNEISRCREQWNVGKEEWMKLLLRSSGNPLETFGDVSSRKLSASHACTFFGQ
jgi:hypothetical protein